jgi:hypothetical protein
MNAFAETLIGAVQLVELQGLRVKRRAQNMMRAVVLNVVAVGLLLAGLVWLAWAGFMLLSVVFSPMLAGFMTAGVLLLLGSLCLWLGKR